MIRRSARFLSSLVALLAASVAGTSHAEIAERLSVDQRGDFALIGNTLAHNCADGVDEPVVGNVGACGAAQDDTGADVLWSAAAAAATASTGVSPAEASSVAVLGLPAGASVTHAELYWSAPSGGGNSAAVTLGRTGVFSEALVARATVDMALDDLLLYQSSADVTALVREFGAGAYQVSGVDVADPVGLESSAFYAGWWLVVFYALDTEPMRHLGLYDGFELVLEGTSSAASLSGFAVPAAPGSARLGVVAYEGDFSADGDELRFGAAAPLGAAAALDDADNFFDGSRRGVDGAGFGVAGDLPRTSGLAESLSGIDLHVVDVGGLLDPGQTSAEVLALTSGDRFVLSGLVLSVDTALPDLSQTTLTVVDVDGPPLRPGDQLEYTVNVRNDGTGTALGVALEQALPDNVTFVPGSLQIGVGASAGVLTDAADEDAGEVDRSAGETLLVRPGAGAAGALGPGESNLVVFRVALSAQASGSIQLQGQVSASGQAGATVTTLTDADLAAPGITPTLVSVDACAIDADCAAVGGVCDAAQSPRACVECLVDAQCPGLAPTCELAAHQCVCVGSAEETRCDGKDDNCDGVIDEGFIGGECSAGTGACQVLGVMICDAEGSAVCGATPAPPTPELCSNELDDDCDGQVDAADSDCESPDAGGGIGVSNGGDQPAVIDIDDELLEPVGTGNGQPAPSPRPGAGAGTISSAADETSGARLGGGGGCGLAAVPVSPRVPLGLGLGTALLLSWRRRRLGSGDRLGLGSR